MAGGNGYTARHQEPPMSTRLLFPFTAVVAALGALALGGCGERQPSAAASPPDGATATLDGVPWFDGLGAHRRAVTTADALAQRYIDQGFAFLFAFNHDEARRAFSAAAKRDPDCAMAHWGVAMSYGPHINATAVSAADAAAARAAIDRALAATGANALERALIAALDRRHADPQPQDRAPLDRAYAEAMRAVWRAHPDDPEVGTFFAEALMDLRPWDLWSASGEPRPETPEVLAVLEHVLERHPGQPLANHLYIHAVEASPDPGRADAAADRLRTLQPGMGHNLHMPSHIDVRRGRWQAAIAANERALAADRAYRARSPQQGMFRFYMAHNNHMLAFAAMMSGRCGRAVSVMRELVAEMPADFQRDNALYADGFIAGPIEALVRCGRWHEVLAEPEPAAHFPLSRVIRHAARGVALAALGRVGEAEGEQRAFAAAQAEIPEAGAMGNNPSRAIAAIAERMLAGEIHLAAGRIDEGATALRAGIALEDALRYDEPPGWLVPLRHPLGAALLKHGRAAEAEQVYRDDLARWPENGWSLFGLASCLRAQGRDATAIEAHFKAAWVGADTAITSSCLCLP
jgi:tetratricopeptide (TPR) repeat protein